ncbi:hypothetical protein, partial [Vibrio harveyi]|uniref:hypothetical protein n=1 Tax=Vibrio harveyi TaxID=669 RepID=UPI000ACB8285
IYNIQSDRENDEKVKTIKNNKKTGLLVIITSNKDTITTQTFQKLYFQKSDFFRFWAEVNNFNRPKYSGKPRL